MSDNKRSLRLILFAAFLALFGFAGIPYLRSALPSALVATMLPVMNWLFFIGMAYLFYLVVLQNWDKK